MNATRIAVTVDGVADALYIRLSDMPVSKTKEFNDFINVDLDRFDMVVGIEVLGLQTDIPVKDLGHDYHISTATLLRLEKIIPSSGFSYGFSTTPDSTTTRLQSGVKGSVKFGPCVSA